MDTYDDRDGLLADELELGDDLALNDRIKELRAWEDATYDSRQFALNDAAYYHGKQWTPSEARELKSRGQAPIVFNRIWSKINFILGAEIESRKSPRVHPRTLDAEGTSDAITAGIRYVCDYTKFEEEFSVFAREVMIPGTGGFVVRTDTHDPSPDSKIVVESVLFDRLFWDARSRTEDCKDASYMGIVTWHTKKSLLADWKHSPEAIKAIESSIGSEVRGDDYSDTRYRWANPKTEEVEVVEHYYKAFSERTSKMEWFECWWVKGGFLQEPREVPYIDDSDEERTWCPLSIGSAFICSEVDSAPERYSPIRVMIGPQDDLNHRRSKSVHLFNTREVYFEEGALGSSPDEVRAELYKPNPFVRLSRGALTQKRFHVEKNVDLAMAHVQAAQEAKAEIDNVGPRPVPNISDNEMSGRLYIAHQEAGAMEMKPLTNVLDKIRLAAWTKIYWLIRQTWTEDKWFIVVDPEQEEDYRIVHVNKQMTRGERLQEDLEANIELDRAVRYAFGYDGIKMLRAARQQAQQQAQMQAQQTGQPPDPGQVQGLVLQLILNHPTANESIIVNDIGRVDVEIKLTSAPNSIMLQHEQLKEVTGLVKDGFLPTGDTRILKMIIESSAMPYKRKLIKILDSVSPEQQQAQQQQAQQQQQQMQIQMQAMQANIAKLQADAAKAQAQAQLAAAKTQTEQTTVPKKAAEAHLVVAQTELTTKQAEKTEAETLKTAYETGKLDGQT